MHFKGDNLILIRFSENGSFDSNGLYSNMNQSILDLLDPSDASFYRVLHVKSDGNYSIIPSNEIDDIRSHLDNDNRLFTFCQYHGPLGKKLNFE